MKAFIGRMLTYSPLNVYQNVHESERTPTFSTKYGCNEIENRIPVLSTHCPVIFRNFNQDTERYRKIQIETERRLMTHPGQHPHQKLINPPVLAIFLCRWSRISFLFLLPAHLWPHPWSQQILTVPTPAQGGIMQWCSGAFPGSPLQEEQTDMDFFTGQLHFAHGMLSQSSGRARSWGKHSAAKASICKLLHFLKIYGKRQ